MIKELLRTVVPGEIRSRLRTATMETGVGRGLRFDPGPSNHAYASGNNELPVQEALAAHTRLGDAFYDIGANVGFLTVIAAKLVGPSGIVYAFEPLPENVQCIRHNVELNGFRNVQLVEKAVAAASGEGQLAVASYSGGSALTTASAPPDMTGVIGVELVSVDDCVFAQKLRPPAVVKIDVEGAEMDVFEGMKRTIREYRPVILCEIDDGTQAGFDAKHASYEAFLTASGYCVERLPDSYPNTSWIVGHLLAVPR